MLTNLAELKQLMFDLANCRDERLDWLRGKYRKILLERYTAIQLASYRDELRLLWHFVNIPDNEFEAFEEWQKTRPNGEPAEMICNRWLGYSETGFLAVWEHGRRELLPTLDDLPALLVYGCLLWGDRLCYCGNKKCAAPWFIGKKCDQLYCSNECAWPAKKEAKRKWWDENRAKNLPLLSQQRRRTKR